MVWLKDPLPTLPDPRDPESVSNASSRSQSSLLLSLSPVKIVATLRSFRREATFQVSLCFVNTSTRRQTLKDLAISDYSVILVAHIQGHLRCCYINHAVTIKGTYLSVLFERPPRLRSPTTLEMIFLPSCRQRHHSPKTNAVGAFRVSSKLFVFCFLKIVRSTARRRKSCFSWTGCQATNVRVLCS